MALFGELLGTEKTITLAAHKPDAKPATASSYIQLKRTDPKELEFTYLFDPITFNSINKLVQTITSAGYELEANSKVVLKYFIDLFKNIGEIGGDDTFDEMVPTIFQNLFIYGKHFIEIIFADANSKKKIKPLSKVVDFVSLDPKSMDYARDTQGKIYLDDFGLPIGYVQKLPYGTDAKGKGDDVPKGLSIQNLGGGSVIFLKRERIAHFKLYTYGDRFDGIGLIEPAYKSIIRKQNIEEAYANNLFLKGNVVMDMVGDSDHYPTADMTNNASEKLAQMQYNRFFAFPYWHKIEVLDVGDTQSLENAMKYYREDQTASLGLPLSFAVGSGEATNRATLTNQQKFLEYTLRDVVKRTIAQIRKKLFKIISMGEGFDEIPRLVWGDIGAEDKNEKARRLVAYTNQRVGILKPEDVRLFAIKSEELGLADIGNKDLELSKKTLEVKESKEEGKWLLYHVPKNKILRKFSTKKQAEAFYEAIIL